MKDNKQIRKMLAGQMTESLLVLLAIQNENQAKKAQKTIQGAARKVARRFSDLVQQEEKAHRKQVKKEARQQKAVLQPVASKKSHELKRKHSTQPAGWKQAASSPSAAQPEWIN